MVDAIQVLYVDDELGLLEIAKLDLEESGEFSVATIDSVSAALDILEKEKFDAIISDYQMPGMDGIQFLVEVRARFGKIPFILFTGKGREEVVIQAINNGADFYVQKGGEPNAQFAELSHKIKQAISRTQAEVALHRSERLYQTLAESSPDMVFLIDHEGVIEYINPQAAKVFRYTPANLIGKRTDQAFPHEIGIRFMKMINLVIATKKLYFTEELYQFADGERWASTRLVPITGPGGEVVKILGIATDVTESKRAEEAFIASEAQKTAILDGITSNIAFVDKDLKVLWANKVASKSVNKPTAEMIGHTCHSLWADPSGPCENCPTLRAFATKKSEHAIMQTPDGRVWDERGEPVFDKRGNLIGVVEIAQDITDRKVAEKALKESEGRLHSYINNAPDGVFITDETGHYLEVNPAACRITGYEKEELLGMHIPDILPAETHEVGAKHFNEVIEQGYATGESLFRHKSGTIRYWSVDAVRLSSTRFMGFVKDITERKQNEEALSQANKKLNLLSGITRHDIKNKAITINGFLRFARKTKDIDEIQKFLDKIQDSTKDIEHQIDFTKDYQDLGIESPKWLNLSNMITLVSNPAIHIFDETDTLQIFADPLFENVMYNLIDNTIRHGETATEVLVSVVTEQDDIRIIWTDNGVGVPADQKEMIFQKGYGKNTGYGLFLAKEILEITGMTIQETGKPGKGARFEITVPNGKWHYGN